MNEFSVVNYLQTKFVFIATKTNGEGCKAVIVII